MASWIRNITQLLAGGAVMGAWGGAIYATMVVGQSATDGGGAAFGIRHVSQRFVEDHMSGAPALVQHFNMLSELCPMDPSGTSLTHLRTAVYRCVQILNFHGKLAHSSSCAEVFKIKLLIERVQDKLERELRRLRTALEPWVDDEDLRAGLANVQREMHNFLVVTDLTIDDMRKVLPRDPPATASLQRAAAARAAAVAAAPRVPLTGGAVKRELAATQPDAAHALATLVGLNETQRNTTGYADVQRGVHRIIKWLQQASVLYARRDPSGVASAKLQALVGKSTQTLHGLRARLAGCAETNELDAPFTVLRDVLSTFIPPPEAARGGGSGSGSGSVAFVTTMA